MEDKEKKPKETKVKDSLEDRIRLRSEEVQEILGRPPVWVIRWGIGVIAGIVLLLLVGSYFFKYPDIVQAPIEVSTQNVPIDIIAKTNGKLVFIFVKEGDIVNAKMPLALIESGLGWTDYQILQTLLDSLAIYMKSEMIPLCLSLPTPPQLGALQNTYTAFVKSYKEYVQYQISDFMQCKIRSLGHQIVLQKNVLQKAGNQVNISEKQLKANIELYQMDSSLWQSNALSLAQFRQSENTYLQAISAYENTLSSIDQMRLEIARLEQSLAETRQQAFEQSQQFHRSLAAAFEILNAELCTWRQTYLLESPISGKITFSQTRQESQNMMAGDIFLTVVPQGETELYGKILLPMQGSGKVKKGQTVNIKFDAYPYMEYGMVKGIIENISLVPDESNKESKAYKVDLCFSNGLTSYYGKQLDFFQKMQGQAEIITEDLRLSDKFLNPIRSVFRR